MTGTQDVDRQFVGRSTSRNEEAGDLHAVSLPTLAPVSAAQYEFAVIRGLHSRCRLVVVAALFALAAAAQRLQPHILDGSYISSTWDTSSGLPQNTVNALLETDDGMIWAATFGGVGRFSGREWQPYDIGTLPGLLDARICALAVGASGEMWFGGQSGSVGRIVGDHFEEVASLGGRPVRGIVVGADGAAVCTTAEDVWTVRPGEAPRRRYATPLVGVSWLHAGEGGVVWGGGDGLWRLDEPAPLELTDVACNGCSRVAGGTAWVAADNGLWRIDEDCALTNVWSEGRVRAVLSARDGTTWFAAGSRIFRAAPGHDPVATFDAGEVVTHLVEARDGSIWSGSLGLGLHRLCARELQVLRLPGAMRFYRPLSVCDDGRDGWWVGSEHGLFHGRGRLLEPVPATKGRAVTALLVDGARGVMFGMPDQIAQLAEDGGVGQRWPVPGLVRAIHRVAEHRLFVGTDVGLFQLEDDDTGAVAPVPGAACLSGSPVKLIRPDGDGGLWVAAERGLLRLSASGERQTWLRRGIELPGAEVRAVLRTPGGHDWCVTYGAGLVALPIGSRPSIAEGEGLPDAFLCSAIEVAGRWLIGSNHGPLLLDPAELDSAIGDGPPWVSCRPLIGANGPEGEANGGNQPSVSVRGTLAAMSAIGGVWLIDVAALSPVPPPPVCLAEVVGEARRHLQPDGSVALPAAAERNVVVRLTGPRFDSPDLVRFRWRLEPGGEWSRPGTERTVTFTLPGAGDHAFVAEALGYDRRAHPVPAMLRVVVAPRLWERGWFVAAVVVAGLVAGWSTYRFGSRRGTRRARWLEDVVDERTRALREARAGLEDRVQERTSALQQAMARLEEGHRRGLELEAELSRARRLEGLGLLAGGVAHDFNNLLTAVLGNAELLEHKLRGRAELVELAQRVREAGLRGRDLTRRLLAVASKQVVRPERFDLGALVETLRPTMQQVLGAGVRLELRCATSLPTMRGARSQVEQILVNLCENAREALRGGGRVAVEVDLVGDRLRLVFADDGEGMPPEVRERAFEPFFSTRAFDQAPGLGLATVLGICRQLGGDVGLDSDLGRGTRFEFRFPVAGPEADESEPVQRDGGDAAPDRRLRVLLVEDEVAVRIALRRMIELCGLEVVGEAENGPRALQLVEDPALAFDVVLSDLRMPGLSGAALIEAMRERRPGLPIVLLTGFAWGDDDLDGIRRLGIELLAKPPERGELLATLQRAVEGRA
ncbi:MAG: response regulator [Planctomycetes bacterium]|nr:response regulator [Planctomycetota bacterium]